MIGRRLLLVKPFIFLADPKFLVAVFIVDFVAVVASGFLKWGQLLTDNLDV